MFNNTYKLTTFSHATLAQGQMDKPSESVEPKTSLNQSSYTMID